MNRNAFTIAEVLLSIVLLSTALMMLMPGQQGSLNRIIQGKGDIERIYLLRAQLLQQFFEPPTSLKSKAARHEAPDVELNTTFSSISKKSTLKAFAGDIVIAKTTGKTQTRTLSLITFIPKPVEETA